MRGDGEEEDNYINSPKTLPGLRAAGTETKEKAATQASNWTTYDDEEEKEELAKAPEEPLSKPPPRPAPAPSVPSSSSHQVEYPILPVSSPPVVVGVMDKGKSYNGLFGEEEEPSTPPPPAPTAATTETIDIDPFDPLPAPTTSSGFEEVADEEVEVLDESAVVPAAEMPPAPLGWD